MLYKELIKSKDNLDIPLFQNGKSMHSKYAPVREAQNFGLEINSESKYTVILGLGAGYHIDAFIKRNPDHFVLVIENSSEDISFLSQIQCVKALLQNTRVKICSKENVHNELLNSYLPAYYGGINILINRAWFDNNSSFVNELISSIKETINDISRDYSVQCHFGFIWQKNILSNLKILSSISTKTPELPLNKKAVIVAAGPSVDKNLQQIINNRNEYFIISTDTAFSILNKKNIIPDSVISIDGQNISYYHFINKVHKDTLFIFDLQANFNAVNYIRQFSDNILFIKSGHPFCEYAEQEGCSSEKFLKLSAGAGTVTIAGVDFAVQSGFKTIEVIGADFSYLNNKPYAKGTYLDILYRKNETKITSAENSFVNLLFRTEVTKDEISFNDCPINRLCNPVLTSYRLSFEDFLLRNNISFQYDNFVYKLTASKLNTQYQSAGNTKYNISNLCESIRKNCNNEKEINLISELSFFELSLFPLISYLRNQNKKLSFSESLKLAESIILEYT